MGRCSTGLRHHDFDFLESAILGSGIYCVFRNFSMLTTTLHFLRLFLLLLIRLIEQIVLLREQVSVHYPTEQNLSQRRTLTRKIEALTYPPRTTPSLHIGSSRALLSWASLVFRQEQDPWAPNRLISYRSEAGTR